jgi:hypothetical protein
MADSIHRHRFSGIESIRISPFSKRDYLAVYFNVRSPTLASATVRRTIVRGIDRRAIARIGCGDPACGDMLWSMDTSGTDPVPLPTTLRAIYLGSEYGASLAGRTLRHQLRSLGTHVELAARSIDELAQEVPAGSFDLALLPMNQSYFEILTSNHASNYTGYASAEFDRAMSAADFSTAERILARDVPIFPLFELTSFAAVDKRLCGPGPQTLTSWRWVADLYLCEQGAPP